jgi:hypothetical protein
MGSDHARSWAALILLGVFHGINPAMGWLFAVALGLQEHRRIAVLRALVPIAAGHALAIIAAVLAAMLIGFTLPPIYIRWLVAAILIGVGIRFLIRHPHLRWAGMRVSMADLTLWSFLVASVHGAGLMVVPLFLQLSRATQDSSAHEHLGSGMRTAGILATLLHTTSFLLVTGTVALLVFEKFGLGLLRKAWFNLDLVWAAALMGTGAATLIM